MGSEPADPELVRLMDALHERMPGVWRVYRGVSELLYAYLVSTPKHGKLLNRPFFRGADAEEVLAKVGQWVATGEYPDET